MFVEFWPVGARASNYLPMTIGHVSAHLLADWVPSLPPAVGSSFIGWPPFLIESTSIKGNVLLALREIAGRSERQWKGVLSWMLGVAGTRRVLEAEGYRWIAPLSAFYPDAVQVVDLTGWNSSFPPTSLKATRPAGSQTRLRPDYLALRSSSRAGQFEWAVVESKGTQVCLTNMQICRADWSNQARNVSVEIDEVPISIPRHLVVATRVNPNAAYSSSRRIQVRAWNNQHKTIDKPLSPQSAIEIVAAHLFGMFKNLGLKENARALALSIHALDKRRTSRRTDLIGPDTEHIFEMADREIRDHARENPGGRHDSVAVVRIDTVIGPIEVTVSDAIVSFARRLRSLEDSEQATGLLKEMDARLDDWEFSREQVDHGKIALPFGIELQLPESFEQR